MPYQRGDNTRRNTVLEEVYIRKVKLTKFILLRGATTGERIIEKLDFKNVYVCLRSLIWETGNRHTHSSGAYQTSDEDEKICMITR